MNLESEIIFLSLLQGFGLLPHQSRNIITMVNVYISMNTKPIKEIKEITFPDDENIFPVPKNEIGGIDIIDIGPKKIEMSVQEL